jgi:hypothetical protein
MNSRRSLTVAAPLLASAALAFLTGCKPKEMQRCVDEHDNVVADSFCTTQPNGQPQQRVEQRPDGHGGFIPFLFPMYRYYYGGMGGYGLGSRVYGGGYTPIPGRSYASPSRGGITRGGFGSSFSSHGGSSGE